jgi:hypothetical protein
VLRQRPAGRRESDSPFLVLFFVINLRYCAGTQGEESPCRTSTGRHAPVPGEWRVIRKRSPWPSALFQTPVTNFWNSSAEFGQRCPAPSPEILRFGDMDVLVVGVETLPPGRVSSVVGAVAYCVRIGCRRPYRRSVLTSLSGVSSLPDHRPFKLRGDAQNVQQASRGRILKISIQPLGAGDKPNAVLL